MRVKAATALSIIKIPDEDLAVDVSHRNQSYGVDWLDAGVVAFLLGCDAWTDRGDAERRLGVSAALPERSWSGAVQQLLDLGLLVTEDEPFHARLGAAEALWAFYGWDDAFYLQRDIGALPRLDYLEDGFRRDLDQMKSALRQDPKPENYKEYADRPQIALGPIPDVAQRPLADVFVGPASEDPGSLDLERFAWLTYHAYGQVGTKTMAVTREHVTKTSPSGGARHPTEVYPIILGVEGVPPGLYHYNVRRNTLELLTPGDHSAFVKRCVARGMPPSFDSSVVYVYSSLFERSMFRYREPFTYRVMSHDIGHLMETTRLLASSIGRRVAGGRVPRDAEVDAFLGIDGLFESTMTYAAVQ